MSIHQLADRCWELTDPADDGTPHYLGKAAAEAALKELRDEDPDTKAAIRLLESACWIVQCDGDCEYVLDEDDEYVFHHESIADALETVRSSEWRTVGDSVFCPEDAPDDAEPPPLTPAEQEAAGQLRLVEPDRIF